MAAESQVTAMRALSALNASTAVRGHWGGQEWLGLAFVAVLAAVAYSLRRLTATEGKGQKSGGLIMGWDKRLSTSKAVSAAWTLVVAYMLLVIMLISLDHTDAGSFFSSTLGKASELYLAVLGPTYLAAVLAKVNTAKQVAQGNLQKSDGSGTVNPLDLISDDSGNTDIYDTQYVLLNLVAIVAVLAIFIRQPAVGFPPFPGFLAAITGGSALVYTANKVTAANPPQLTTVSPSPARVGDKVTATGQNFLPPGVPQGQVVVTVGSASDQATVEPTADDPTRVTFAVPAPPSGLRWPAAPQDVTVATSTAKFSGTPGSLLITPDVPVLQSLGAASVQQGSTITLTGYWFLSPDGTEIPTVYASAGQGDPVPWERDPDTGVTDRSIKVKVPPGVVPAGQQTADVAVTVNRSATAYGSGVSNALKLTVTA